jgi:hypothetical protein
VPVNSFAKASTRSVITAIVKASNGTKDSLLEKGVPMLSFQINKRAHGEVIQIACDAPGMSVLLKALATLIGETASHVHLRGPKASGSDLNETSPWGNTAVSEVIIDYAQQGDRG